MWCSSCPDPVARAHLCAFGVSASPQFTLQSVPKGEWFWAQPNSWGFGDLLRVLLSRPAMLIIIGCAGMLLPQRWHWSLCVFSSSMCLEYHEDHAATYLVHCTPRQHLGHCSGVQSLQSWCGRTVEVGRSHPLWDASWSERYTEPRHFLTEGASQKLNLGQQ